ncbi:MAG: peptidylprolyl isomerase [Gammaproteobacteria bacterium]|nr:peptidylprolyl isomerase [Gammaproteobacteria bacterium]
MNFRCSVAKLHFRHVLLTLLTPFFTCVLNTWAVEPLDSIVAVVNDDVIMQSELENRTRTVEAQLKHNGTAIPPQLVLQKQVLERLILMKLQLQLAQSTGIRVDDDTLNRAIGRIAENNGMSLSQFREILERDGYNFAAFREDMRDEITITQLRQRQIDNQITVTDREIDNLLSTQKNQGDVNAEYHLAHILIATPEAASPEQLQSRQQKAEQVLAQLRAGADFKETAVAVSDGQQALDGGDLGWRKADQLPTIFAAIVPKMNTGDVSDLIQSASGFHIIKVLGIRGSSQHMVTQTHVRHILVRPSETTSNEAAQTRLEQLKPRVAGGEDFAELARSHSDDTASAINGGDLGWVNPGDLVPEFEAAMDSLSLGQTSDPVRTQFGWHLIQVIDRRDHDSTEEVKRAEAREVIRQRKIQENQEAWLRQMRDEAYVEYRLNE